jgi:tetratricopeptide (TPR) repeat protein
MMVDQSKASQLARAGFDLWQAGRLEEAVPLYREALEQVDPDHWGLEGYHGEFAAVLASLGRDDEAREQYELSLAAARRNDRDEQSPGVLIARYFLSEHLLKMNATGEALAVIEPVSFVGSKQDCALLTVQAQALWGLSRYEESRLAAEAAIAAGSSEEIREHVRGILASIIRLSAG